MFATGDSVVGMAVVFAINLVVLAYCRFWCVVHDVRRHWPVPLSLLGFAGAFVFKTLSNEYYPMTLGDAPQIASYDWLHSMWHLLAGVSSTVLMWDARHEDATTTRAHMTSMV